MRNQKYVVKRANKKLWCLKRLINLGAKPEDLLEVHTKQIRCLLEHSVAVWHPSLTEEESIKIERVQKSALSIILEQKYKSYKLPLQNSI